MKEIVKRKYKQLTALLLSVILLTAVSATTVAYAYFDNDRSYTFKIASNQRVTKYGTKEFRNTKDNNNAWKVKLNVSGEGDGKITQFRLGLADGTAASSWANATQGAKAKYSKSNDAGKHVYVYLNGRNNNKNATTYTITGVWDEETGKAPN